MLAVLNQLLAIYDKRLGALFPDDYPDRVLSLLGVLSRSRESPLSRSELVKRSGVGKSAVQRLVTKFRGGTVGIVQESGKRGSRRYGLSEKGLQLVAELENDVRKVLSTVAAEQRLCTAESSEQPVQPATIPPEKLYLPGTTRIYKEWDKRRLEQLSNKPESQ